MPVYLDTQSPPVPRHSSAIWSSGMPGHIPRLELDGHSDACLHIGLVNNMPLAAMKATESQFLSLLHSASAGMCLHVSLYTLPGVRHLCTGTNELEDYASLRTLWNRSLDGLIVTGAEPMTRLLADEPYWPTLTRLVEWAAERTYSAVWSCLAAHAAVLVQDGIPRIRAHTKQFGVFRCTHSGAHPLLHDVPRIFTVPHSRWNSLDEEALTGAGYSIVSRTEQMAVDAYVKQYRSLFVFLQGHPEYAPDALLREYRRDMTRYVRGEADAPPNLPLRYFDLATEALLTELWDNGRMSRTDASLTALNALLLKAQVAEDWRSTTCTFYRNWLGHIRLEKMKHHRKNDFAPVPDASLNGIVWSA